MDRPAVAVRHPDQIALILAIAILVGLWSLGASKELWFDERFMAVMADRPIGAMIDLLRSENNPPLSFFLLHGWQRLFGDSIVGYRLFALIPSILSLVALQWASRMIIGRRVAAMTVALAGVSGLVVAQAGELRMYPWLMLWSTLAVGLAWASADRPGWKTFGRLSVVLAAGVMTHYTFALLAVGLFVWLFFRLPSRRLALVGWFAASALVVAPWLALSVIPKLSDLTTNVGIQRITNGRWEMLLLPFRFIVPPYFLFGGGWEILRWTGTAIIAASLCSLAVRCFRPSADRWAARFVGGLFLAGSTALFAVGLSTAKYATVFLPVGVMAVAWGAITLPMRRWPRWITIGSLLAIAGSIAGQHARLPYVTYARAADVVAESWVEGDRALIYPFNDFIAVRPAAAGRFPIDGFFPLESPAEVTFDDVVRYNFRVTLNDQNINQLAAYVGDARRVWFFFDVPPTDGYWRGDLIHRWFLDRGYRDTWYREIFQNVPPLVIRYERPT